jgi:hypothetical protein
LYEVEQLTLWEVNDLMAYWQDYPPTHVLVSAYLMGRGKHTRHIANKGSSLDELSHAINTVGGSSKGRLPEVYRS